jgi:hypothetical protein
MRDTLKISAQGFGILDHRRSHHQNRYVQVRSTGNARSCPEQRKSIIALCCQRIDEIVLKHHCFVAHLETMMDDDT